MTFLRLAPNDIWSLGLAELNAVATVLATPSPAPRRAGVEALMRRFPDRATPSKRY